MPLNTFAIATTRVNNAMAAVKAAESVNALLHLDERDQASLVERSYKIILPLQIVTMQVIVMVMTFMIVVSVFFV